MAALNPGRSPATARSYNYRYHPPTKVRSNERYYIILTFATAVALNFAYKKKNRKAIKASKKEINNVQNNKNILLIKIFNTVCMNSKVVEYIICSVWIIYIALCTRSSSANDVKIG